MALTFENFPTGTDDLISKLVNKSELVPTSELLSTSKLVSTLTSISKLASTSTAELMRTSKLVSTKHMMHTAQSAPPCAPAAGGHGARGDTELEAYAWINYTEFEAYSGAEATWAQAPSRTVAAVSKAGGGGGGGGGTQAGSQAESPAVSGVVSAVRQSDMSRLRQRLDYVTLELAAMTRALGRCVSLYRMCSLYIACVLC